MIYMNNHTRRGSFTVVLATLGILALLITACNGGGGSGAGPDPVLPVITTQPKNQTVLAGGSVTFTVEATDALTYQWIRGNGDTIAGATLSVLTLPAVDVSLNGTTYKCVAGNSDGTVVSTSATLSVYASELFTPRSVLLDTGAVAFSLCAGCHNQKGVGSPGFAPPIGQSDFFMEQRLRPVRIVLLGMPNVIDTQTILTVNGLEYNGGDNPMSPEALDAGWSNLRIAGVLTYIRAVLNDSTSTNCNPDVLDGNQMATCTRTPRPLSEVGTDSIAVWEVKALRDSLADAGLIH